VFGDPVSLTIPEGATEISPVLTRSGSAGSSIRKLILLLLAVLRLWEQEKLAKPDEVSGCYLTQSGR
jgi:hypothetical protein